MSADDSIVSAPVRFPTRLRALQRLGLDHQDRRAALDTELRRVETTIATLLQVKAELLAEYKRRFVARSPGKFLAGEKMGEPRWRRRAFSLRPGTRHTA